MGTPKQLLTIDGEPLILRAVKSALDTAAWPIVVVVGANAELIRPILALHPVLLVENAAWIEGMASSIRTGIETLQQFSRRVSGALVILCDQPALSASVLSRLIQEQERTGRSIVAARYNNRNGAPALFMREHFSALRTLTGEEGARSLLNSAPERIATVELPELAVDLDTPADYAAYRNKTDESAGPAV
jgi:molybdenum cofactor cytidylyltransferase